MERQPRTQDISWFLDINAKKQLDLDPPYQRRSVWTQKDREYFIDTIFKNYPSPAIFLHRTISDQGVSKYHVVDGKQRLQTIIMFAENKLRIPQGFGDDRLNGKKWADLSNDDKQRFWNYSLLVEMLPTADPTVVNSVFERVNRNSRKLTRQELRHAKYDGWLSRFVEAQAAEDRWSSLGVVTKTRSRRMADAQFLSELLAVVIKNDIQGFDQDALDELYAEYDDPDEAKIQIDTEVVEQRFNALRNLAYEIADERPDVKQHLKTVNNFYTLWGFLQTHAELPAPMPMDDKFARFMATVTEFIEDPDKIVAAQEPQHSIEAAAKRYAVNSVGASTDLPARRARLDSLTAAMSVIQ